MIRLRWRRRGRADMPAKFHELARYNAERWRGIVHTPAQMARMSVLQAEFDQWADDQWRRAGFVPSTRDQRGSHD